MSLRLRFVLVMLGLSVIGPGQAAQAATLTEWGAFSGIATAPCPANDHCHAESLEEIVTFALSLTVGPTDGGQGAASTSVTSGTWSNPGSAQAAGTVSGDLSVPRLTAGAVSAANQWVGAAAFVAQGYDYTGPGETLQLNWGLTGTIENPDGDPMTGLAVVVSLFAGGFQFLAVNDPWSALAYYELLETDKLAGDFVEFDSGSGALGEGTLSIGVAAGDQIYLVMGLMAAADGEGARAESLSTLTASFEGSPPLVQANALVPLPAAFWLFGSGLIGLLAYARRRAGA